MMWNWLQEACELLAGGLADSPQFLDFSQRAASLESSWFRLGIFGALGLNNRGNNATQCTMTYNKKKLQYVTIYNTVVTVQYTMITICNNIQ